MKNLWDRWVSIDISAAVNQKTINEAKRGSKRFCGRIVNGDRAEVRSGSATIGIESSDLFFDSTSQIYPWYR